MQFKSFLWLSCHGMSAIFSISRLHCLFYQFWWSWGVWNLIRFRRRVQDRWNALGRSAFFQEHFLWTKLYAQFGGQNQWIVNNWKIENGLLRTFYIMWHLSMEWIPNDVWTCYRSFMSHCLSFVTLRITRRKFSKPPATLTKEELQTELKGHSQLWGRSDLETSFLTLKKVHTNLK